jgi:putative FmdB family regulatory protein
MPLYEYRCDACGHTFEVIQKFSDAPIAVCPVCGGAVQKLMSSPAIHFKGSGWYVTDYAKKDSGRPGSSSKSSNGASSSSESGSGSEAGKTGEGKGKEGKSGEGKSSEGTSGTSTTKADSSKKD